jgi:hypothetical protein
VHCLQLDKSSEGYNVVAYFLCNIRERLLYFLIPQRLPIDQRAFHRI